MHFSSTNDEETMQGIDVLPLDNDKNISEDVETRCRNNLTDNVDEDVEPSRMNQFKDKICQTILRSTDVEEMTLVTITEILCYDKAMSACAGLSSLKQFQKICEAVEFVFTNLNVQLEFKLDVPSRILLTLMKLKLNLTFHSLPCLFKISERTASEYFFRTILILHSLLKQFIIWLPKDTVNDNMPIYFAMFSNKRVIVNCAEVPVKKISASTAQYKRTRITKAHIQ